MATYNSGKKYNTPISAGGLNYNGSVFAVIIRLYEAISANEKIEELVVSNILSESFLPTDKLIYYAFNDMSEKFSFKDDADTIYLIQISEKLGIKRDVVDVIVALYLREKVKVLDQFRSIEAIISQEEKLALDEITSIDTLIKIADDAGLSDVATIFNKIKLFESTRITDKKPRKAISDFLIGYSDTLDSAYEWFLPLEMLIDADQTSIQVMPSAENTYIEMPYVDGTPIENTVYKNRFFNIVAWSKQGLTIAQKEQLKYEITQLLDSTKSKPKKLTIQKSGTSFDVKYSGQADIKEGPSFVKASIPFELPPYGYPVFDQELFGSGLLINDGDADAGFTSVISGGCVNPSFRVGSITYKWNGTVPVNQKLVINQEDMTCYLEDFDGKRTNVLNKLEGDFQMIPRGTTMQLDANETTKDYIQTFVKTKILWKKAQP